MSLELANTFATFGTFLVIAATAIAALIQLRHARSSNQIEALAELREEQSSLEYQSAAQFVRHGLGVKLEDAAFRYQIGHRQARTAEHQSAFNEILRVGNFFENMGVLVKSGLADEELVLDIFSTQALGNWEYLTPVVAIIRQASNDISFGKTSNTWQFCHKSGKPSILTGRIPPACDASRLIIRGSKP
jgi:Domain of unknown function (DUF4760)